MKSKWKYVWLVIALLVVLRIALPVVALRQVNKYLENFSTTYHFHIADLDISLLRGAYRFEGFTGKISSRSEPFLNTEYVDISVAWRDLFRGKITTDIFVNGLKFVLSQELLDAAKNAPDKSKSEARELGSALFPLKISRLDIRNSEIQIANVGRLPEELRLRITQVEGRMSNLTPTGANKVSLLTLKATLLESTDMKIFGQINLQETPNPWVLAAEVHKLALVKGNTWLKRSVPLSFKSGVMDLYGEMKSEKGNMEGYAKPFVKKLAFVGNKDDFKSLKQFGIEISGATGNLLLRRSSDKTFATKINFSFKNGKFDWDASKALSEAIEHGYGDGLKPGIENKYQLAPHEK